MSVTVVPEAQVARLMDGFLTTQLLYVAAQLGIADALTQGPRSATELAQVVGARTGPLARVLRGLAIEGVIEEREDGRFALTTAGARLAELHGPLLARGEVYYRAAGGLLDAVGDGGIPFERVHGETVLRAPRSPPGSPGRVRGLDGRAVRARGATRWSRPTSSTAALTRW